MIKRLFLFAGIALSVAQTLFDSLNQLSLPEEKRVLLSAILMFSILVLDGVKRYFDPATMTNTLWITVSLFIVYVIGGIAQHMDWFTQLGITEQSQSYIRLGFMFITMTLNQAVTQLGGKKPS